ncbi:MAG TPA: GTP-binding protein [Thermodesulfobacteriota bacterium]|nr:GTP-binding protein [Thermodesulfobacteriota bacterium]
MEREEMNTDNPVPLTIIGGFLGAGKTTLLNYVLHAEHGRKVAVLVNDFGEINIDSELIVGIENEVDNTISLSNGCICCSLRGDMLLSIIELLEQPEPPEYIIIEASGVSDPAAIALSFPMPDVRRLIRVENIITVVDAEQVKGLTRGESAELGIAQISVADVLVLNKADLVGNERLSGVRGWLRGIMPGARIVEARFGRVPLELVFGLGGYDPDRLLAREPVDVHVHAGEPGHSHAGDRSHEKVFATWSFETGRMLSYELVRKAVKTLPPTIFRAKGILHLDTFPDMRGVLNVVGRRCALSWGRPWGAQRPHSRFVLIGTPDGVDAEMLEAHFEGCLEPNPAR